MRLRPTIGSKLQIVLFSVLTSTYFLKSLLKPYPLSGDEPNYLMDAISIGLFRTRQSKPLYDDPSIVLSIYPSPNLSAHVIGESNVSYHGVGLSIFLIPSVFFASKVVVAKLIVSLIAALSITVIFALTIRMMKSRNPVHIFVVFLLIGLSGPMVFNASLLYPEHFCTLLLALSLNTLHRDSHSPRRLKLASICFVTVCLSYIWWLNTRYIPLAATAQISVLIYIAMRAKKNHDNSFLRKAISIVVVISSTNILLITFFFKHWYGTTNLFFVSQLQPSGLRVGDFAAIYRTAGTYLFGQAEGLIPWAPTLLLAIPGFSILWAKYGAKLFYSLTPAIIYFGTIIQAAALGGNTPPHHYTALLVPFLGIPIAEFIVNSKRKSVGITSGQSPKLILEKTGHLTWNKTRHISAVATLLLSIVFSLGITLTGINNEGSLYMRSASQESPILPLAKIGASFWPHYLSPNKDNGSLGVPPMNSWTKNQSGNWQIEFSQGYRSAGAYDASIDIESTSKNTKELTFYIGLNHRNGVYEVVSKKFEIGKFKISRISVPFQFYETSEIVWRIEANSNTGFRIAGSDLRVLDQQRPSGFSDLGFTVLAILLLMFIYRRELVRQKSKSPHINVEL